MECFRNAVCITEVSTVLLERSAGGVQDYTDDVMVLRQGECHRLMYTVKSLDDHASTYHTAASTTIITDAMTVRHAMLRCCAGELLISVIISDPLALLCHLAQHKPGRLYTALHTCEIVVRWHRRLRALARTRIWYLVVGCCKEARYRNVLRDAQRDGRPRVWFMTPSGYGRILPCDAHVRDLNAGSTDRGLL